MLGGSGEACAKSSPSGLRKASETKGFDPRGGQGKGDRVCRVGRARSGARPSSRPRGVAAADVPKQRGLRSVPQPTRPISRVRQSEDHLRFSR